MSPEEECKIEELATRLVEKVKSTAADRKIDLTKIHRLSENRKADIDRAKRE